MYSTVKEIHIALDQKIQQVNSNRKQAFYPEEYDIAINEAIREYVNSIFNAKYNQRGEGVEQTVGRIDDLRYLRKEISLTPYYDNNLKRVYVVFPADYKDLIASHSNTIYYRGISTTTSNATAIARIYDIRTLFNGAKSSLKFTYTKSNDVINYSDTVDLTEEYNAVHNGDDKFLFTNRVIDILQRVGVDAYYENVDGIYKPGCIICSNLNDRTTIYNFDNWSSDNFNYAIYKQVSNTGEGNIVENDLLSTEHIQKLFTNMYTGNNRHYNPVSEIVNDRLYVYVGNDFVINKIHLSYYKNVSLLNYRSNLLPDIPINDSIVDRAARIILGVIKDGFGTNVQTNKQIIV